LKHIGRRAIAWFVLVLLIAGSAGAATLLPLSPAQLKERAALVVQLEAVSSSVQIQNDIPFTVVTCRVLKQFKGTHAATVTLRVPGGKRGDLTMVVPGATIPQPGDVFVAFLEPDGAKHLGQPTYRSIGLGQGIFAIVERAGKSFAVQALARAPERLRDCAADDDACLKAAGVLAFPLAELTALLQTP